MRSPLRNPKAFRPEPDDDLRGLSRQEFMIVEMARHSLRETVARFSGPDANELQLVMVATCGLFGDLVAGLSYAPALAAAINQQIEHAGWQLVPVARN
jgi:hypothetical protein